MTTNNPCRILHEPATIIQPRLVSPMVEDGLVVENTYDAKDGCVSQRITST